MAITMETRMTYWRSLLRYAPNVRLASGYTDELRTALRDALAVLEDLHSQVEQERQRNVRMGANPQTLSPVRWRVACADAALCRR